jgi:hypothetical protein
MLASLLALYIIGRAGILAPDPLSFTIVCAGSACFGQNGRFIISRHRDRPPKDRPDARFLCEGPGNKTKID